ncbi:glycosyltransferase [Clostridium thermarum]|uniref:glycosyltransferase n=1 Tax=Clostridium thermarum TaxID=1716543 RepID=UPI001121EBCE|nr:glycosyltransferase [Clostridium thermarum]
MEQNKTPLLTAHIFVADRNSQQGFDEMLKRLSEGGITIELYNPCDPLVRIYPKSPRVYVSIGGRQEDYVSLYTLPLYQRKRWIHYDSAADIQPSHLFYCWLHATDPLPKGKEISYTGNTLDTPLVSVFTAAYKSRDKILRPYQSLLNQTYTNWEWIIVDDSGDEDETYKHDLLPLEDKRVRRYRQDSGNGYIGATKRYAAGLCTGEILVELDHDDELMPNCLEKIVDAFKRHPECGFAYGDCTEVYVGSNNAHWYGWDSGFGYYVYYRVWVHKMNRWQNVYKNTAINGSTIRHLVGLPNHPRAWRRDFYHLIGGHREELLVADDYDMLVRSFLNTRYLAIPDLLYIQYRNENGDNSTFHRNWQIQVLVRELNNYYRHRIGSRLRELDLPEFIPYSRVWQRSIDDPGRKTSHIINEDPSKVSMIFPIPYSCPMIKHEKLLEILDKGMKTNFKDLEVVVVGRVPPEVEEFASKAPMGAIRWWPMEPNDSLETCTQYAMYIASCKEKIVVPPENTQA